MDVYKLRVEDTAAKPISLTSFEAETLCREPWYQDGSAEKRSQFAVCPACDSPIQLIGLYELPKNVNQPFGRHTSVGIRGIAPNNPEARACCPYFNPRPRDKSERKTTFDCIPRKIVTLLIEQFDRVVYLMEMQTNVKLSQRALRGMLERYKGERGYMYTGATLRNVPWIFAYMSDATDLFGQDVGGNEQLAAAIKRQVPGAQIDRRGRLLAVDHPGPKKPFIDLKMSFIRHRISKDSEDASLNENMELVVSRKLKDSSLVEIHRETIQFEHVWFERLIYLPSERAQRNPERIALAREVLGDLL